MPKKKTIILLLFAVVLLVGCSKRISQNNVGDKGGTAMQGSNINLEEMFTFYTKAAYKKTEDGWLHYVSVSFDKQTDEPISYVYDAYHLKYKRMQDFVVEIEIDGKDIKIGYPSIPYYSLKNDFDEDYKVLDTYFETNKPTEKLTDEDIANLDIKELDKDMIVELFNIAIESEPLSDGKYYYMPEAAIWQEVLYDGFYWQIGYFCLHGELININIELLYEDGTYLSDIVAAGNADDSQIAIDKMITDIENKIMDNQDLTLSNKKYVGVSDKTYERLNTLMKRMATGEYDHTYNEVP